MIFLPIPFLPMIFLLVQILLSPILQDSAENNLVNEDLYK